MLEMYQDKKPIECYCCGAPNPTREIDIPGEHLGCSSIVHVCENCALELRRYTQDLASRTKVLESAVVFGPYLTPVRTPRNPDAPPLWLDLSDGTTLPGVYMDIVKIVDVPNDNLTARAEETSWLLVILSDTLGVVDVDARHVVRIGTDPSNPVSVKSPADVAKFVETFRAHEP